MRATLLSLSLPLALLACQDYRLKGAPDDPVDDVDSDTAPVDTYVEDTEPQDSPPEDTGEVVIPDTGEVATESVYLNTSSTLFSYDPGTNTATQIGRFSMGGRDVTDMTDIAIDLSGHMFGVTFSTLYQINPSTAAVTMVAPVSDDLTGLTFVSDGRLVGTGSRVSFVDTSTGALTQLVASGRYTTSGDIIGLPDGMLYWTVEGGDDLVQVDPNSGATVNIGNIGVSALYGLGYADGVLLGFTSGGRVVDIDAATARNSNGRTLSGSWWGATTNPVLW